MPNRTSPHILGTSANLLGFCLVVITSLHISGEAEKSLMDECASVIALLLTASSLLSFVSIRSNAPRLQRRSEAAADALFVAALLGIVGLILFITFSFWNR